MADTTRLREMWAGHLAILFAEQRRGEDPTSIERLIAREFIDDMMDALEGRM